MGIAVPTEPTQKTPNRLKIDATLVPAGGNQFTASVEVGQMAIGDSQNVDLELFNASDSVTVDLTDAVASCGCVKVEPRVELIAPGESGSVSLVLSVKSSQMGVNWVQSLSFGGDGKSSSIVRITLKSKVQGVLSVAEDQVLMFFNDDGTKETKSSDAVFREVAIEMSEPVRHENIKIAGGDLVDLLDVKLKKIDDEKSLLVISADKFAVPKDGIVVPISLTDSVTHRHTDLICTVGHRQAVSILPAIIRLYRNDNEVFGEALVSNRVLQNVPESKHQVAPAITASIGGEAIEVRIDSVNKSMARVKICLKEEEFDKLLENRELSSLKISWHVSWGEQRATVVSQLLSIVPTSVNNRGK